VRFQLPPVHIRVGAGAHGPLRTAAGPWRFWPRRAAQARFGDYVEGMAPAYTERKIKGHVVGVERLEPLRWRVTVDGLRLFTFCTRERAQQAGAIEARRLDMVACDRRLARLPR
jgi:hypothetical protein